MKFITVAMINKISVVVPCYNQAQYLSECLQSVLNQTYADWECIVIDDGSPDNTEEVAMEWCHKDSRFRYLKKDNGGLANARNAGIAIATGSWILPLDADDKIGEFYLDKANDVINNNKDVGVIYCNSEFFWSKSGVWKLTPYTSIKELLISNSIFCSAFFQKSDWVQVGGYDEKMIYGYEDWEFWIRLLSQTHKEVIKMEYIGFYYRIKEASMLSSLSSDADKRMQMDDYVYEKYKDLYMKYFGSVQSVLDQNKILNRSALALTYIQSKFLYKVLRKLGRLLKIDFI